ncbi:hypothetical protein EV126DRAFT_62627 [Verticillium dahliae]|nr:hypothetical protein EV126DRAFT_62627 [Verticillium dahliae]
MLPCVVQAKGALATGQVATCCRRPMTPKLWQRGSRFGGQPDVLPALGLGRLARTGQTGGFRRTRDDLRLASRMPHYVTCTRTAMQRAVRKHTLGRPGEMQQGKREANEGNRERERQDSQRQSVTTGPVMGEDPSAAVTGFLFPPRLTPYFRPHDDNFVCRCSCLSVSLSLSLSLSSSPHQPTQLEPPSFDWPAGRVVDALNARCQAWRVSACPAFPP